MKKKTINPKNEDDKFFQYMATAALNLEEIPQKRRPAKNIKN